MKLTAPIVAALQPREKRYKIFDGKGLHIQVNPCGGKYWRYKFRYLGKEQLLSLGVFPEVSPDEARRQHKKARDILATGVNPLSVMGKTDKAAAHRQEVEVLHETLQVAAQIHPPQFRHRCPMWGEEEITEFDPEFTMCQCFPWIKK